MAVCFCGERRREQTMRMYSKKGSKGAGRLRSGATIKPGPAWMHAFLQQINEAIKSMAWRFWTGLAARMFSFTALCFFPRFPCQPHLRPRPQQMAHRRFTERWFQVNGGFSLVHRHKPVLSCEIWISKTAHSNSVCLFSCWSDLCFDRLGPNRH